MDQQKLTNKIFEQISELPLFDAHTHLVGGKMGAQGLQDIILYHMAVSDMYAAGCPSASRLTRRAPLTFLSHMSWTHTCA